MSWIGDLGKIIGTVFNSVTKPMEWIFGLIFNGVLGSPTNPKTPLGFLFQTMTGQLNPVGVGSVSKFYQVLAPSSLAVLTLIAGLRILKLWKNEQMTPTMVLMDVVPKWGFLAVVLAPGTNIGYNLFGFVVDAFGKLGGAITGSLLTVTTAGHVGQTFASIVATDLTTAVVAFVVPADPLTPLLVLFGIALAAFLVYLVALMFMRSIILLFCLTLMPIALPIALYDPQNGFYKWWLGSATGALAAQIIGGVGFAVTFGLAMDSPGVGPIKAVTTVLLMIVGLTFTTKAVRAAESGTMGGAGIGIGGLVEVGALGPRAVRNVLGSQLQSGVSGSFTKLGQGRLASGGTGSSGGGGGGGGGGGNGFDAGPRGMLGMFFPRHNVQADAVGVAAGTVAGAVKGFTHKQDGESRGQSLWFGANAGRRMAMGTATAADAARAIGSTRTGRLTEEKLNEHWQGVDSALSRQAGVVMNTAQTSHDELMAQADAVAMGRNDDAVQEHLAHIGYEPGTPVGQSERDEAAAAIRQRARASIADAQAATDNRRAAALAEFEAIKQGVAARQAFAVQSRRHPARVGAAARLTQTEDAHLQAQLRAHATKYGVQAGDGSQPSNSSTNKPGGMR